MTKLTAVPRASQPGSTILNAWMAEREAARAGIRAENGSIDPVPASEIVPGTAAFSWLTGGMPGDTPISERAAMSVGAIYAGIALLGGVVGALTLETYERDQNGSPAKVDIPERRMLNLEMHPRWASPVGWEYGIQSLALHGDMFIRIHRRSRYSGVVKSLEPLHPLTVDPRIVDDRLVYVVVTITGDIDVIDQDDMLHVPGPGFDGRRGMSAIRYALRSPAAVALALGRQSERTLNKGMRPDLVLTQDTTAKKLGTDDITTLRAQWVERYANSDSMAPIILTGGMGIKEISMKPQDVQLVQVYSLSVEDSARILGIPPFLVGQTEKQTSWGTGVAEMGINFVKYSLIPRYLNKIETECNRKMPFGSRYFVEYNTATLERADIKSRFDAYRTAIGRAGEMGWMRPSEVRRLENLPADNSFDTPPQGNPNATE
jgi:HK97 family phage portal protein